ncbi:MAG: archaeosortase/exosortase family protein [Candidatus Bathyarchaeia archaeon]
MRLDARDKRILLALYPLAFAAIALTIYHVPDYFYLKWVTAVNSAWILKALGFQAAAWTAGRRAFINEVEIVKDCTGIQVVAVFAGLLVPMPGIRPVRKLQALGLIFLAVYVANVFRIVLELWLLYSGILPWSLAHEPLGTVLGVISVAIFLVAVNHYIPQVGDYIVAGYEYVKSLLKRMRKRGVRVLG